MATKRQKAIRRRRIFIVCCVLALAVIIAAITGIIVLIKNALSDGGNTVSSKPTPAVSSDTSSVESENSGPEYVTRGEYELDANFKKLLLVNNEYELPGDYNYGANLTSIEAKYHNGQLDQINEEVWPYMKAMIEAAWKDGVQLYVWSPYRSYETQNMLFQKQVNRCIENGTPTDKAEEQAATVVARPGTSEHNTGLCADFNMADDRFEQTEMYKWMCENAEDYGFILRYPKESESITGVIYESWHWRFVGINTANEINDLGITLEEYIKLKNIDPQGELDIGTP